MPRTIKKYANRRLYDTTASKHVTLDGIRELVASGEDVRVVDDTNGEDITRNVLMQIISEQEQGGGPILSNEMLMQLIRFYGNPMQGMMTQFLEQSFATFVNQQQDWQAQFQDAMAGTPLAAMESMMNQNLEAWNKLQKTYVDAMTPAKKKDD
ncbi:MAG: polyhydroxyalkanoate synthesis repressor PhaR [Gammaproteobacteria bacterium]